MSGLSERFWPKVDKSGECWEWTAHCDVNGYGRLNVARVPKLAHRLSWVLTNGPIPEGMYVCHHCDNPPCVRPDHLFLGSAADNWRDMAEKGRGTPPPTFHGADHPAAILPDSVIREVRESYAAGRERQHEIATRLGVGQTTVGTWVRGDVRPEAGGPIVPRRKRRTRAEMAASNDVAGRNTDKLDRIYALVGAA